MHWYSAAVELVEVRRERLIRGVVARLRLGVAGADAEQEAPGVGCGEAVIGRRHLVSGRVPDVDDVRGDGEVFGDVEQALGNGEIRGR